MVPIGRLLVDARFMVQLQAKSSVPIRYWKILSASCNEELVSCIQSFIDGNSFASGVTRYFCRMYYSDSMISLLLCYLNHRFMLARSDISLCGQGFTKRAFIFQHGSDLGANMTDILGETITKFLVASQANCRAKNELAHSAVCHVGVD